MNGLLNPMLQLLQYINSKTKIIYALNTANIRYYLKCRDINRYSATKRDRIGKIGIKPKYVTEIFVDRENADMAKTIVRAL